MGKITRSWGRPHTRTVSIDAGLVSAVIISNTRALGARFLFNFVLLTLCLTAMLAVLFAIGLAPFWLAVGTSAAMLSLVTFHILLISPSYTPAAVMFERAVGASR